MERRFSPTADFAATLARERAMSPELGGRTVFDDARQRKGPPRGKQLPLF
ncbi:MAG: hypothetical protein ABI665_16475 [Vicinamibacterales bacterium]